MESHAWLVSAFLCLIGLTAVFEGFSLRAPAPEVLVRMAAMVASGFIGWFSLKRYIAQLGIDGWEAVTGFQNGILLKRPLE